MAAALEGHIDAIRPDGVITGWACNRADARPCHVQIKTGDRIVAEAFADQFRHDLFENGLGHGHYAFVARLQCDDVPPGWQSFDLYEARVSQVFPQSSGKRIEGPPLQPRPTRSLDDLLTPPPFWSDAQVLARLDCLQLEDNLRRMGVVRFVDVTCRYVLHRWLDDSARMKYVAKIKAGTTSATEAFRGMMLSKERKKIFTPLAGVFDSTFPYTLRPLRWMDEAGLLSVFDGALSER